MHNWIFLVPFVNFCCFRSFILSSQNININKQFNTKHVGRARNMSPAKQKKRYQSEAAWEGEGLS
jgi:hypothetical protein